MYSEWVSLTENIRSEESPETVLKRFPQHVGRDVVQVILKPLTDLGTSQSVKNTSADPNTPPPRPASNLTSKDEVLWTMQVIGFGLTLPLAERNLIASCLEVYDSWLSALYHPRKTLPQPIMDDPGPYAQIIFKQFCYVFVPRVDIYPLVAAHHHGQASVMAQQSNHAVLCDRVLQITHHLVRHKATKLSSETWNVLLEYLLKILDMSLSPPTDGMGLGSMLCDKLIHVFFEAWLRSCSESFPSPALWKSLRELCCCWRHHPKVVEQWNKMMYSLTLGVIRHLYSPRYLSEILATLPTEEKDFKVFLDDMPKDCLVQSWFRLLHTLGNPVDLLYPNRLTSSPAFQKVESDFEKESRKHRHPPPSPIPGCINTLPSIFHEAMKGVAALVYLFLGQELPEEEQMSLSHRSGSVSSNTPVPGALRHSPLLLKRSNSRPRTKSQFYVNIASLPSNETSPPPSAQSSDMSGSASLLDQVGGDVGKPKGNTLLHLFGGWLFSAAIWPPEEAETKRRSRSFLTNVPDTASSADSAPTTSRDPKTVTEYEAGRAEAFGALCSIFSSQQCGEAFLPIYLARFYHALAVGLKYREGFCLGQMLTKIILNSPGLLRKDLQGINVIVPSFLSALELILPYKDFQFKYDLVDMVELRHSSINLLLSMMSLPLHFLNQPLPDLGNILQSDSSNPSAKPSTFFSLKDKLLHLLFSAIQCETDPHNIQLLLHALMVFLSDIVSYENSVNQMISSPTEEVERSTADPITNKHPPLTATSSNVSTQSYIIVHSLTDYSLGQLFKLAIEAGHKCLSKWAETSVALAALELMGGLAQLQIDDANHADFRQALLWVCDYIKHQSSRDHPQHSRDLHTTIVAAFSTILTWLNAHPYLMGTKECLVAVMEVIELGISGSVSAMPDGEVVYKGEKELKPVSGRVKEIAEFMLSCVMEKIGSFPSPCGAESASSLLSEEDILAKLPQERRKDDAAKFTYFVVDNSLILALMEEPFSALATSSDCGNGEAASSSPLPTLTAIVRSPTGRHVWSMQLRHNSRSEEPSSSHLHSVPRPNPKFHDPIPQSDVERRPWPEQVEEEPGMQVENSIPHLEDILDDSERKVHENTARLMDEQVAKENRNREKLLHFLKQRLRPDPSLALEPPQIMESFNTARMFLSHLGMLGIESIKDDPLSQFPAVAMLDSNGSNFVSSLCSLDRLPSRFCNTVFVIYCKEGATKPEDILSYQDLSNKPPEFIEFLEGLGWIVNPITHPGFAGKVRQVRNSSSSSSGEEQGRPVGVSAQIPFQPFPYFADAINEIAFVVPQLKPSCSDSAASLRSVESSDSGQGDSSSLSDQHHPNPPLGESAHQSYPSQMSLPMFQREPQGSGVCESTAQAETTEKSATLPGIGGAGSRKLGAKQLNSDGGDTPRRRAALPQDCATVVVWLEKFEDHLTFPLEALTGILHGSSYAGFGSHKLSTTAKKILPALFIHKLSSGLYQTLTKTPSYRQDFIVGPLVDGMVISRRSLSALVRQTTINMCFRHRMENEGYSPPHVRRKRKIEEIVSTFRLRVPVAEFYTTLFTASQH